jgi:uncharacterized protein (TIGR00269 family)
MNCKQCGSKSYFELRYSGHHVCGRHFRELFERRVKRTIRQNNLIENGDHIVVALSGGKDSMACLAILKGIVGENPKISISAVTVDEGIRGKNMKYAVDFCESLGVEHQIITFRKSFGLNIDEVLEKIQSSGALACSVCGVLKRRLLNDFSKKNNITKVATGHNLDDEIQSAFMNLLRGDHERLARLGAIVGVKRHSGFTPRIKILRECPEDEVRAYANLLHLPYFKNQCIYAKTSLRTTVKGMLDTLEKNHPGSKYQMISSIDGLSEVISRQVRGKSPGVCEKCAEPSAQKTCRTCQLLAKFV